MTVPLLTPEVVKQGATSQQREQQARMRDMATEEERLIQSINELRQAETDEKARIREDVATFRNEAQAEVAKIDLGVAEKKREVEDLEARRTEAMKPIEEIRAEADARNEASKKREDALEGREKAVGADEEKQVEAWETIHDRQQLQDEREKELDEREIKVKSEEEISKESLKGVSERWVEFHRVVAEKEEEFVARESNVSAGEKTNSIRATELEVIHGEQVQKDRQIADKYATLGRARTEFEKMQQEAGVETYDTSETR